MSRRERSIDVAELTKGLSRKITKIRTTFLNFFIVQYWPMLSHIIQKVSPRAFY